MEEARQDAEQAGAKEAKEPKPSLKRCPCGYDRNHPMVSPKADYTFLGWCLIMIGISAKPTSISFVCRTCDTVVERTTNPKDIAETRLWG